MSEVDGIRLIGRTSSHAIQHAAVDRNTALLKRAAHTHPPAAQDAIIAQITGGAASGAGANSGGGGGGNGGGGASGLVALERAAVGCLRAAAARYGTDAQACPWAAPPKRR